MLFAADVLTRNPGAQIIYDVKCTRLLAPWIRQHGGAPLMWKTGHSLDQGQAQGNRRAAGRRDERPHLLQGALVRLRRRALRRRAPAGNRVALRRTPMPRSRSCRTRPRRRNCNWKLAEGEPHALVAKLQAAKPFPDAERRDHHRRRARRVRRRLRPGARLEHHAGDRAALRGRDARRRWSASRKSSAARSRRSSPRRRCRSRRSADERSASLRAA